MSDGAGYPSAPRFPIPPPPPGGGRSGPPWEGPGEFVQRYVETVRSVLTDSKNFYANLRLQGGLQAPVVFALVGLAIAAVASSLYSAFGPSFGSYGFPSGGGFLSVLIASLVGGVIGLFIGSAIFHLVLSLLGAARQPFEATLRVVAYTAGSTALIGIIPVCGGLIGAVYAIFLYIIGLADVHQCDMGKAAIAVLAPVVVCCVLFALLWGTIMALVFGAAAGGLAGAGS
jgi:hypothetical protein